ncbi:MAG: lysophospholipid acyltransferase family protein [Polyangiales bacterium]
MVKPRKEGAARRRAATISLYATSWVVLTALAPAWVPLAWILGLFRQRSFIVLRLLAFGWFYFGFEMFALLRVAFHWTRLRYDETRCFPRIVSLQTWWATTVLTVACRMLRLEVSVEGAEVATRGPAILLIRHASILDTLLPCVYLQRATQWQVRYILKQELLVDPCLDVVGHILPNYFVDRTGNTAVELQGIRDLVTDLGTDGVLIYPEGTRFSPKKRERALARVAREMPAFAAQAETLVGVLPPKPGGVLTLLEELPDVDCVFVAHTGLEHFATVRDLLSGSVVGSRVQIRVWRVSSDQVPRDKDDALRWLFGQWGRVSEWVCQGSAVR